MNPFIKYLLIIFISVAFGYFWAYQAYTPHIDRLKQEVSILRGVLMTIDQEGFPN